MTACIVGVAHTPFGKLDTESVESLIVRVAHEALADEEGLDARRAHGGDVRGRGDAGLGDQDAVGRHRGLERGRVGLRGRG